MASKIATQARYYEHTGIVEYVGTADVESWDDLEHLLRTDGYAIEYVSDTLGHGPYTGLYRATREYATGEWETLHYLVGETEDDA